MNQKIFLLASCLLLCNLCQAQVEKESLKELELKLKAEKKFALMNLFISKDEIKIDEDNFYISDRKGYATYSVILNKDNLIVPMNCIDVNRYILRSLNNSLPVNRNQQLIKKLLAVNSVDVKNGILISQLSSDIKNDLMSVLTDNIQSEMNEIVEKSYKHFDLVQKKKAVLKFHKILNSNNQVFGYTIPIGLNGQDWEVSLNNSVVPSVMGGNYFFDASSGPSTALGVFSVNFDDKKAEEYVLKQYKALKRIDVNDVSFSYPSYVVNIEELVGKIKKFGYEVDCPDYILKRKILCVNMPAEMSDVNVRNILEAISDLVGGDLKYDNNKKFTLKLDVKSDIFKFVPYDYRVAIGEYKQYTYDLPIFSDKDRLLMVVFRSRNFATALLERSLRSKFENGKIKELSEMSETEKSIFSWCLLSELYLEIHDISVELKKLKNLINDKDNVVRVFEDKFGVLKISIGKYDENDLFKELKIFKNRVAGSNIK